VIRLFPERGGWLEVVCGPMFSGKSEELIRRLRRAEIAGQRALIVKPRIDDRFDIGHVVSHAGAKMRAVAVSRPDEIPGLADGYDVIGIDEVQFFAAEIVLVIDVLVERGTRVVAAGLDQDFRGLPFGSLPELLCRAELVDKLQAVCHRCGGPATMTQRLVDGHPAPVDDETIVVGALDSYEARCRACHVVSQPEERRVGARPLSIVPSRPELGGQSRPLGASG
jgi:thymidine kinase